MALDLHLGEAFKLVMKTKAYLIYRATIYGIVAAVMLAGLLFVALVGYLFHGTAALIMFLILAGCGGFGLRFLKEYVLYMLQAGQLALLVELIDKGELPAGASQTEWAKERVTHYFKEVSALALVDQLVKGIIGALNRTLFDVMTVLPIPGMDGVAKLAQTVVDFSLTYVDESIIAYTFRTRNENVFDSACGGVILYCQAWKGLLKNAVALTLLSYLFVAVAAVVLLVPLGILALMLPHNWEILRLFLFGTALVGGWAAKWILFDPLACTATVLTFLRETEGMQPDAVWEERIAQASGKFGELKAKAAAKMREMGQPAGAGATPQA